MSISGVYISNRRVRIQLKESSDSIGGAGTSARSTGPPRPRSTSFTSEMELPQSSQSSTQLSSSSSSWCSAPSSPGAGGEGPDVGPGGSGGGGGAGKLGGISSGGGHSRLPSTDSGIQADAGWDSLNRSHVKALGKVATESLTSPDSRTPLKTLTRCLMEPRAAWDAEHLTTERGRSGTQPPGGADSHGKASANSVVRAPQGASARTRTLSCDSDVRTSSSSSSTSSSCTGPRPRTVSSGSSVRTISIELVGKAPTTRGEEVGRLGDSYPSSSPSSPTPSPSSSSSSSASKTAGRSVLPQGVPVPVAVADSSVLAGSSLRAPVTCVAVPNARPQRLSPGSEPQQQLLGPRSELEPSGSWSEQLGSKSKQLSPRSEYVSSRSEQSSSRSEQLSSRSDQLGSRSGDSCRSEQQSCRSSGQSGSRSGDSCRSEQHLGSSSERLGSGSSAKITGSSSSSSSSSASCFSSSSSSLPRASAGSSCEGRSAIPPGPLSLLTSSTPVLPSPSAQDGGSGGPTPEGGDWVVGGRDLFPPNARLSQQSREGAAVTARFPKGVAHQQQYHHQVSTSSGVQTSDTSAQRDVAGPPGPQGRRGVPQQQGGEQEQAASMTTSGAASHFRYAPVPAARTVPVQVVGAVGSNLRVTVASSLARAPPPAHPPHHHQPFGAPTQAAATVAGGAGGVGGATGAADSQSQPVAAPRLQPSSPSPSSSSSSSSQSLGATGRPQPLSLQPTSGRKPQPTTGPTFTPTLLRLSQPTLLVPARLRAQSVAAATTTTPASRQHHQGRSQQLLQQQQQLLSPRVFGNPGARPRFVTPLFRSKLSPILPRRAPLRIRLPVTHSSSSAPSSSSSSSFSSSGPGPGRPIPVRHVDTCSACLKTGPGSGPDPVPTSSPAPVPATAHAQQIAASGGVGPSVVGGKANGAFDARERPGMVTAAATTATATTATATASATAGSGKAETSPEGGRPAVEDGVQAVGVGDGPLTASLSLPGGVLKLLEKSAEGEGEGGGGGSEGEGRTIPILDLRTEVPWKERRSRIDSALSWLRTELESLRAMDTALMTQFRRCQDTIESLKQQQQHSEMTWGEGEGGEWGWGLDGSEFDEEEEAWEDWEIAEFERKWAENPDAKELDITLLPANTDASKTDVTTNDVSSPRVLDNGKKSPSPLKQDVEATL